MLNSSKRKTADSRRKDNLFNKMLQRKTVLVLTFCPKTQNLNLCITLNKNLSKMDHGLKYKIQNYNTCRTNYKIQRQKPVKRTVCGFDTKAAVY